MRVGIVIFLVVFSIMFTISPASAASLQGSFRDVVYGGDSYDYPWAMEPLPDGGFIIVATTQSFSQPHLQRYDGSLWLARVTTDGRIALSLLYTPPKPAIYYDSTLLPDESIVVVGSTGDYRNAVIARISGDGTPIFYEYLDPGVPVYSIGLADVEYYDGRIVAAGFFYDLSVYKSMQWIVVLDPNGTVLSSVGIDLGAPYYYPITFSLDIMDGLAVIAGYGYTNPGFAVAYNLSSGAIEYAYSVGDSSGDRYFDVKLSGDRLLLVGVTDDLGGEDASVVSLWENGTLDWGLVIGSDGIDRLFGLYLDGQYVYVSGWSQPQVDTYMNDTLIAKIRLTSGTVEWYRIIGSVNDDWAYRIHVDGEGYVYSIGGYGSSSAKDDVIILRLDRDGRIPGCRLVRNETLSITPYTPPITPITPAANPYTTTATPLSIPYTNITGNTYRLCQGPVGGASITSGGQPPASIYILIGGILLAIVIFKNTHRNNN